MDGCECIDIQRAPNAPGDEFVKFTVSCVRYVRACVRAQAFCAWAQESTRRLNRHRVHVCVA